LTEIIRSYVPRNVAPAVWAELGPFVRRAVEKAQPHTRSQPDVLMSAVAQLAIWSREVGLPLAENVLLHPDTIDRFVIERYSAAAAGTRSNYRSRLRRVGEQVLGHAVYPLQPMPYGRAELLPPYSRREIAALTGWSRGLPTPHMRHNALALLALGLGAGLRADEISRLVGNDVRADGEGTTLHVAGDHPRLVAVIDQWGAIAARLAAGCGTEAVFLSDRERPRKNDISNFVGRLPQADGVRLQVGRLRTTWIVQHLMAGTRFDILVAASGAQGGQIGEYVRYLEPYDLTAAAAALRFPRRWQT